MTSVYMCTPRKYDRGERNWKRVFDRNDFGSDPYDIRFARVDFAEGKVVAHTVYDDLIETPAGSVFASEKVFGEIKKDMETNERNTVLFVHGFNNSYEDAVIAAYDVSRLYNVNVLCFSFPSDGLLRYRDCKMRALMSVPAFDKLMEKLSKFLGQIKPGDACGQRISGLFHSMGNYILKKYALSTLFGNEFALFDNINLFAPDVNNEGHEKFVDKLTCKRVNVFINEDDIALDISDTKRGRLQKVRLGNYLKNLDSKVAHYYNVSDVKGMRKSHGYFKDEDMLKHAPELFKIFNAANNGERIAGAKFHPGLNYYTV